MNVLFLDQFSELGGAQRCLLDLAPALLARGWQVQVAAPENGALRDRIEKLGGAYHQIRSGPYQSGGKSMGDLFRFAGELPRLVREIASLPADIVYVNGPRLLPAAALATRGRVPLIFHMHSHLSHRYDAAMTGIALAASGATLIANCRYVVEPLRPYVSRAEIVYNGVEGARTRRPGVGRIGIIGRIAPEKGQLEFVEMARSLPYRFVICGAPLFSDSDYFNRVKQAAQGLPVEFLGWRDDINEVLSTLDLLVIPSGPREATTRVILEAFAAGVPVAAANVGGIPEIVIDGETGFLTSTIQEVMKDPDHRARVADNAHEAWKQRYTLARYQAQILSILDKARA